MGDDFRDGVKSFCKICAALLECSDIASEAVKNSKAIRLTVSGWLLSNSTCPIVSVLVHSERP